MKSKTTFLILLLISVQPMTAQAGFLLNALRGVGSIVFSGGRRGMGNGFGQGQGGGSGFGGGTGGGMMGPGPSQNPGNNFMGPPGGSGFQNNGGGMEMPNFGGMGGGPSGMPQFTPNSGAPNVNGPSFADNLTGGRGGTNQVRRNLDGGTPPPPRGNCDGGDSSLSGRVRAPGHGGNEFEEEEPSSSRSGARRRRAENFDEPQDSDSPGTSSQEDAQGVNWFQIQRHPTAQQIPQQNNMPLLQDVMTCQTPGGANFAVSNGQQIPLTQLDYATAVHESEHGCNAETTRQAGGSQGQECFHYPGYGGVCLRNTGLSRSEAARYIPGGLRGSRWDTYIQTANGQDPVSGTPMSNGVPVGRADQLYLWNEGFAYVIGAKAKLEMAKHGQSPGNDDLVLGALEFLGYMGATLQSTREHNPNYADYAQMKAVYKFLTDETMQTIRELEQTSPGILSPTIPYMETMRGYGAKSLTNFLGQEFGADWVYDNWGVMPETRGGAQY